MCSRFREGTGPFRSLDAQRLRARGAGRIQHEQPAIGPRRTDVCGIELGRSREQDVAVRQVQRACKAEVWKVRRQVADDAGRQIDLHGVAERLGEKQHALAVQGEVGPFTEPGQLPDVRRQILVGRGRSGGSGGRGLLASRQQGHAQEAERYACEDGDNRD